MKTVHRLARVAGTLALVSLAACGGNGDVGGAVAANPVPAPGPAFALALDPERAQALTGSGPPAETVVDMRARTAALVSRSDSFVISTIFGNASDPNIPTSRLRPSCSDTACTWMAPGTEFSWTVDATDLENGIGDAREILGKHGVTTAETAGGENRIDVRTYGAWLDHASFTVMTQARWITDRIRHFSRYSSVLGDLSGSAPGFAATWRGLMVGVPYGGGARDDLLQGDAALTYTSDGAGGEIDAAFTNIRNLDANAPHSTPTVRFDGVSVAVGGVFEAGFIGNRIQGGFYGPGQTEAAGVFEQADIVGAFGARRVEGGAP